jgi:CRP/FNR family transcriptional regulator, cyclic AMP receptor protein
VTTWLLLESLPFSAREEVLRSARRRHFARGEAIVREGDLADGLHLIDRGICAVQVSAPGGERLTLNVLTAGGFFGELALLHEDVTARRTASVLVLAPTETLTISRGSFQSLRTAHPAVGDLVVSALAQRVADLSLRLLEAQYDSVDRRVHRRLLELADLYPDQPIPLSQDDLAAMVGAARPTVNQVLQKLVSRGVITLGRRQLMIGDQPALRALGAPVGE